MKRTAILSLLILGIALHGFSQSFKSSVNLPKGQQLQEITTTEATTTMNMMGQDMEMKMTTIATSDVELKNIKPDGLLFGVTLKRLQMIISSMGQVQNIDTDSSDLTTEEGAGLKDIIGKTQEITTDKEGKITTINNPDSSYDQISKSVAALQNNVIVGNTLSMLCTLGGKTLKPGESWTEKSENDNYKSELTYTLKSVQGNEAAIDYKGTVAIKNTMEQGGMDITVNVSGTVDGKLSVDLKSGVIRKRNATADSKGNMEMMGQAIDMKVYTVSESVVLKK